MGVRAVSSNKHTCELCSLHWSEGSVSHVAMWFGVASAVWTALISFFFQPKHFLLHDSSALKL